MSNNYPFKLELSVQRRPHMRDENLEMLMHIGQEVLRQIFDDERTDSRIEAVEMYYPERWMNVVEERSLWMRLARFCPNLKTVKVVTQSVYLIQCTRKEDIRISSSADEITQLELAPPPQESVTGRLWYANVHSIGFPTN